MAEATATLSITDTWSDGKRQHVIGTIAIGASPLTYATGGIVMALTDSKIKSQSNPKKVVLKGLSAEFSYRYKASTELLMIFDEDQTSGVTAELAVAAIPAGVSGDTIDFEAIFDQLK